MSLASHPLAYGIITAVAILVLYVPTSVLFSARRDTRAIVGDEIERQIRLCTATNGFQLLFTLAIVGSERLLLAEATTNAMATNKMSH